ncbi:MAG: glycosyltransferase [Methyloglobulus sp.]|nr:glycosyltransferase [Methyloglobulus sp.]
MIENRPPLVSVLMPVYNAEQFLVEAIESVLKQTFTDFEFIIINDGSNDKSLQILQYYATKDNRICLISRENRGLVKTLNEGVGLARTPYIARMDADDISYPDRLFKQVKFLNEHPNYVVIGSRTQLIDEDGDPLCFFSSETTHQEIDFAHLQGKGGAIAHPAAMFRKNDFNSVGQYRTEFIHAEDLDLWLRMAEVGKLGNLPDLLLDYRQHVLSVGYKYRTEQIDSTNKAIKGAYERRGIINADFKIIEMPPANKNQLLLKWGWWALTSGNIRTARKYAIKAFKETPFSIETLKLCACVIRGH